RITLVETGADTMTGGRLKAIRAYLDRDSPFCFTYGDGLASVDITALIAFHEGHGKKATISAVAPPGRFGAIEFDGDRVHKFREKPDGDDAFINGGFFVADPSVLDLVEGPHTAWEREPLEQLAAAGELMAYRHTGFWQPMDTLRDKVHLEELWRTDAPWKCW
ncbi:MAG: glucose-1-phosphate cytidylyltransferase, partial [Sphingomonas bacterium]|nr:glucose-1-phosphate cytidylyltransferase [Sphingomonas bacterium]